jgi:hypothetical protein
MSQRKLAFAILLFGAIAFALWFNGARLDFLALLDAGPVAGMYGAAAADLHKESPAERAARFERLRELRAEVKWSVRVSLACAAMVLLGTLHLAWQTRREVLAWHWLSFFGLAVLAAMAVVGADMGTRDPWRFGLLALDGSALGASVLDLRRHQFGSPGRIVAWAVLSLSVILGLLLVAMLVQAA